jgi:hypothetical protein
VEGEVDVDLGGQTRDAAAYGPHGVGAQDAAVLVGLGAPDAVPVAAARQVRVPADGGGEHELDALVEAAGIEVVEAFADEGDAQEGRADPLDTGDGDVVHAPGSEQSVGGVVCRDVGPDRGVDAHRAAPSSLVATVSSWVM